MPFTKAIYLAFATTIVLLFAGWLARAQLAELAVTTSLPNYGFENVSADVDHLSIRQINLKHFAFTLPTDTGNFRLVAEDASIDFRLQQLRQAQVDSLMIDKLTLYYQADTDVSASNTVVTEALVPVKILATFKQALRDYIVFNSLSINLLSLHGEPFGALERKPLKLQARNENSIITSKLSLLKQHLTGKREVIRQLVVSRLSEDTLQANLRFNKTDETATAGFELGLHDTSIDGKYYLYPHRLTEWLEPFTMHKKIDVTSKVSGSLSVDLSTDERITSTVIAATDRVIFDAYRADQIEIRLKTSTPTSQPFRRIELAKSSYISVGQFSQDEQSLASSLIHLAGDLSTSTDSWQFDGSMSTDSVDVRYQSQSLQLKDVDADILASHELLDIDGRFSTTQVPGRFSFAVDHDQTKAAGTLAASSVDPIDLNAQDDRLSDLWTPWPYPFDLLSGIIRIVANAAWSGSNEFTLDAKIHADNTSGNYNDITFSDLSLVQQLEILPALSSTEPGEIFLAQLDSGVIASNISTSISLQSTATGSLPSIIVQDLYGEILGGSFSADNIVFDLNADSNRFDIKAEDIDLGEIVAAQQLEGVEVTGRVDGRIPIMIDQQGIVIEQGKFISKVHAGTIRYNPAGGTEQLRQNPLTGIALDALRDFRYSHLSADVDFKQDGTLTVNLKLKGTSPELDTKRPVHLNINTEQNLLSLLKSLRYAESVSTGIDQKVRSKYDRSKSNTQDKP
ncbi:MAG: YdbH domain-containing protein [Gammaproteobacteria bacterium]|nr:YdbH domain-containing protein [Gammaproteobacteria bacterium]